MSQPAALRGPAVAPPVADVAARIARTDLPVLITGEPGTGKRHLARWIHGHSSRAERPLVDLTCAALSTETPEPELFGGDDGAAAVERGRGTLLLAAVDMLTMEAQRGVLRLLVDKRGRARPDATARILATTSTDLAALVAAGRFRVDLYYRLKVVHLELPPLRARREQIDALVRHFVGAIGGGRRFVIPSDLLDVLRQRRWPGNVRELENACAQLVASCPHEVLRIEHLPPELPSNDVPAEGARSIGAWLPPDGIGLFELERRVIGCVMEREKGNVTRAAAYLKIPRHILAYRLRKYGLRRS